MRGDSPTLSPSTGEGWGEGDSIVVPDAGQRGTQTTLSSFPRKPLSLDEPGSGADPARLEHMLTLNSPVIPREAGGAGPKGEHRSQPRSGREEPEPVLSTAEGPNSPVVPGSLPSFPRRREPIPGPSL